MEPERFSEVQLGDCGDVVVIDPWQVHSKRVMKLGQRFFAASRAILNFRWRSSMDIGSFGATVSYQGYLLIDLRPLKLG